MLRCWKGKFYHNSRENFGSFQLFQNCGMSFEMTSQLLGTGILLNQSMVNTNVLAGSVSEKSISLVCSAPPSKHGFFIMLGLFETLWSLSVL